MTALSKLLWAVGGSIATIVAMRILWKSFVKQRKQVGVVSKLVIYPIKSCKGIQLSEALCTPRGLVSGLLHDRQFMVADAASGEFVSARTQPSIVLVKCAHDPATSNLVVTAPGMEELIIDMSILTTLSKKSGTVFDARADAVDCGTAPAEWFSQYLKIKVVLLYFDPSYSQRKVEPSVGPEYTRQSRPKEENAVTMFADGYPYLICNDKSVAKVNADIGSELVTWENFRPNILLTNTEKSFDEDNWRTLEINELKMFAEKPCGRCRLPNVNPSTGVVNPRAEPYNTLYKTRMLRNYDKNSPMFGMNLILDGENGSIHLGDPVFNV